MKLLVISHSCVTAINQQFFAEVEARSGWNVTIVTPANWKNDYGSSLTPGAWNTFQGTLQPIPVWNPGNIPLHCYRIRYTRLLQELQPDFIYVHHEPYALATAQVYWANHHSIRCPIAFFTWQNLTKQYPIPFRQIESFVYRRSAWAFAGSQGATAVLRSKGYSGQSCLLPGSIDPTCYYPHPDSRSLRQSLDLPAETVILGYVGRIVPEKGLRTLLSALNQIRDLDWRLVVIGSGAHEAEFDRQASALNLTPNIIRLGYVPHEQAPLYLSLMDGLVLPSETQPNWQEQFGRVVIEAIACGTAVIGSDSGEIPHLINAIGGGLIFPEKQADRLADRLRQFILDPGLRTQLVRQGQRVVSKEYSHAAIADRFIACVEQSLPTRPLAAHIT